MQDTINTFADLGLSPEMVAALNKKGFDTPSPIQALVIPEFLNQHSNIIGQAQTGTGKTAAFSIPILETIKSEKGIVKALILTPTRELANQVSDEIYSLIGSKQLRVLPVYGGQSIEQQIKNIQRGVDIIVGTPGRIIDLLERKCLNLKGLEFFVLDEADEMLNMGFVEPIEYILSVSNKDEQKMLFFSATMPPSILNIAKKYMGQFKTLKVATSETTANLTEQIYYEVREGDKFEALCRVLDFEREFYGIVFAKTKHETDEITSHLKSRGYDAEAMHGDVNQAMRNKILANFKKKQINILVATDVAARGIDVNDLTHVINYSIPNEAESYVHRIGRTGRAGKKGIAITFVTSRELYQLGRIEKVAKTNIKKLKAPSIDDVINAKKETLQAIVSEIIAKNDYNDYIDFATQITAGQDATILMAAVLRHVYNDEFLTHGYKEIGLGHSGSRSENSGNKERGDKSRKNNYRDDDRGNLEESTRLFIARGKKDNLTPRALLELLHEQAKTPARKVRDIKILDSFSFITVPFDEAELIMKAMNRDKSKKPLVTRAKK